MIWQAQGRNPLSARETNEFITFARDVSQEPSPMPPGLTGAGYASSAGAEPPESDPEVLEFLHTE